MRRRTALASVAGLMVVVAVTALPRAGAQVAPAPDPRATIFIARGCTQCHAITAFGVKAGSDVGPDLTFAYADVPNRYGVSLEWFLYNPTGVMRLMLASHLHLSRADRDSIIGILKALYVERGALLEYEVPFLLRRAPRSPT